MIMMKVGVKYDKDKKANVFSKKYMIFTLFRIKLSGRHSRKRWGSFQDCIWRD